MNPNGYSHRGVENTAGHEQSGSNGSRGSMSKGETVGQGMLEKDSLSPRKSGGGVVTPGGGGAVGVPTVSVSGSPARRQASPQPISPTRRFDPFAPLDHNSGGQAGVEEDPGSNSYLYPTTSISRENRPSNLYIPMQATVGIGGTGNTPTWPFTRTGSSAEHLFAPPLTSHAILSPSMIHPSYADDRTSASSSTKRPVDPILTSTSSSNQTAGPTQKLYSAIPVSNAQDSDSDGTRSPGGRSARSRNTSSSDSLKNSKKTNLSSPHLNPSGRHQPTYSLGTHALLSSRSPSSARIYAALDTPTSWLILYFSFNLGLTLFNKLVMKGFPFPWSLTGIQMLSGTIGTQIALSRGYFVQARLNGRESATMVAFSILYTVNIAVSNLSLHLVTVPFHQVVRAMTPLFTIALSVVLLNKRHSRATYFALLPVIAGVVFATYGDYDFTPWGLILTLFGTLLAALKTIVTNRIQVGRLKLHPLDLLIRMSPLAFMQCVICAWYTGELDRVRTYGATEMTRHRAMALVINGAIAFGLNVVSFTANKKTSALTMTVAANVKQVLTIILAVLIFNISLNPMKVFGISLTLCGGAYYAKVELQEKSRSTPAPTLGVRTPSTPLEEKRMLA